MGSLRNAMQRDGPSPGYIDITVSRKVPSSSTSSLPDNCVREVRISQSDAQSDNVSLKSGEPDKSAGKDTTDSVFMVVGKPPNPVTSKLAAEYALRNVSYQRATHESMMNETTDSVFQAPSKVNNAKQMKGGLAVSSPTLNTNRGETVLIEGENYQVQMVY